MVVLSKPLTIFAKKSMLDFVLITPEHKIRFDIFYKNKIYKRLMNFYLKKNKISNVHVEGLASIISIEIYVIFEE